MKENIGSADRIVRIVLALILGYAVLTTLGAGFLGILAGILAVILLGTAVFGFCPLYLPLKVSTKRTS